MIDFDTNPKGGTKASCNGGFWFTIKNNNMPNAEIDKYALTNKLSILLEKARSTMLNRIPPKGPVPLNSTEYKEP
jgi:hypothetical protein